MALFYDRDYADTWSRDYERGYRARPYWGDVDREPRMGRDRFDRGYKSRWQTDFGDPFNDRAHHTPIRMTRGEYRGAGEWGYGWGPDYDRDFSTNPMGYDPYYDRNRPTPSIGRWSRYDRSYRGRGMGRGMGYAASYDEGWF